jgi:hypothetical protein
MVNPSWPCGPKILNDLMQVVLQFGMVEINIFTVVLQSRQTTRVLRPVKLLKCQFIVEPFAIYPFFKAV